MKKGRYLIQLIVFCIIACFVVSVDGFAKDISFDEVPETIRKIALREIGDVPISDVDREKEDGETVYDIEAKDDSIDIELEIAADGTFREKDVTEKIAFSELPIPVQDTVRQQVGMLKINDVERRTGLGMSVVGNSLQTETTYYNVEAEEFGVEIDLEIAPDGRLLDIDISDPIRLKVKLLAKSKIPDTFRTSHPIERHSCFTSTASRNVWRANSKAKNSASRIGQSTTTNRRQSERQKWEVHTLSTSIHTSNSANWRASTPVTHLRWILTFHSITMLDKRFSKTDPLRNGTTTTAFFPRRCRFSGG